MSRSLVHLLRVVHQVAGRGSVLLLSVLINWTGPVVLAGDLQSRDTSLQKTILWVDSYHPGFEWTDGIEKGIRTTLADTGVDLTTLHMDTKRNKDEAFKILAGEKAFTAMQQIKPDLVIASDDNAQRYFVLPYLRGADIPVVFCGVNWDAAVYGYPWHNVTGMVEVDPVRALVRHLDRFAPSGDIGFLSEDTFTANRVYANYNLRFFNGNLKKYLVRDFDQFKASFLRAQQEVGKLIISNYAGIEGWEPDGARRFLLANIKVPTGSFDNYMAGFTIFTVSKVPEEQGEWVAMAARRILGGTPAASIPITQNEQADLTVNLEMARALGITIPVATLRAARVIGQGAFKDK